MRKFEFFISENNFGYPNKFFLYQKIPQKY